MYSQAGKAFLLKLWESGTVLQVRNFCSESSAKFAVLVANFKLKIPEAADIKAFYYALLNVFSKKCKGLFF